MTSSKVRHEFSLAGGFTRAWGSFLNLLTISPITREICKPRKCVYPSGKFAKTTHARRHGKDCRTAAVVLRGVVENRAEFALLEEMLSRVAFTLQNSYLFVTNCHSLLKPLKVAADT